MMQQRIWLRAVDLYWAFMPEAAIIDRATLESWQFKLCWDLAIHIEQDHLRAHLLPLGHE